jgi:hypothetical protein
MVNQIEKLFCVEILEKISRMQRFLLSEPDDSRRQGAEVIGIFRRALDGILDNLTPYIVRLSKATALSILEKVAIIRRLSDIFNSIDELHAQLQFIYGTWVKPETHIFINNILEFVPKKRRPGKVNVVLSNTYSFEESDLSSYFEYVLSTTNIPVDFQSESPTVFLPKIERDNSLNWAILAHECGHVNYEDIRVILQQPGIIPAQADTNAENVIRRWAEEIYCDLLATKILGPAYLASFAMFALLVAGAGGSEFISKTHPADIVRVCIIYEVLQKKNLKVVMNKSIYDCDDMASFFYTVLEERTKLDRKYAIKWQPFDNCPTCGGKIQQPQLQLEWQDFVDAICEQVDSVVPLDHQLKSGDFNRITKLSERLSKGILIGSYRDSSSEDLIKKYPLNERSNVQKLSNAKKAVQESRTLSWEIINAGWLHKIEHVYPEAFNLFFSSSTDSLIEKIREWGQQLESIDRLLLKSMESSEIQRLMEEL